MTNNVPPPPPPYAPPIWLNLLSLKNCAVFNKLIHLKSAGLPYRKNPRWPHSNKHMRSALFWKRIFHRPSKNKITLAFRAKKVLKSKARFLINVQFISWYSPFQELSTKYFSRNLLLCLFLVTSMFNLSVSIIILNYQKTHWKKVNLQCCFTWAVFMVIIVSLIN